MLKDYILADYVGDQAPHAEVSIYYGKDTWRDGYVKVCNIVPLQKNQLTIEEYNQLLDLFYNDIAKVYGQTHDDIKVVGPSSGRFNPLDYISESALNKLTLFCNAANKSTKRLYSQPQMHFNSPKPPLLRTYHIRKACISQVLHQKRKSVSEQSGSGDTER